jgi:hypothetical protein
VAASEETKIKKDKKDAAELKFSLMIIVPSIFYTITRLVAFTATSSLNIYQLIGVNPGFYRTFIIWLNLFVTAFYFGMNLFIYLTFNNKFRSHFRKILQF